MISKQPNLIYALKDGTLTSVEDVENGLKCGCVCPACGEQLIARKGEKVIHHFAHHSGTTCDYGYETSLHLMAKEILSNAKKITIPAVQLNFNSYKSPEVISDTKEIPIDRVVIEQRLGEVIPDIIIRSGGRQLFLEIYVTHRIDDDKLAKIKRLQISTIEIDLSDKRDPISFEGLSDIVLGNSPEKKWKYNAATENYSKEFYRVADKRQMIRRGFAWHIDNCPIRARIWRRKPCANVDEDCLSCRYCISLDYDKEKVLCTGKTKIETVIDLKSKGKDLLDGAEYLAKRDRSLLNENRCPRCGCDLVKKTGKHGPFLGCSNYPYCNFTANIDAKTGEIVIKDKWR